MVAVDGYGNEQAWITREWRVAARVDGGMLLCETTGILTARYIVLKLVHINWHWIRTH
jgi:hypothetical protein